MNERLQFLNSFVGNMVDLQFSRNPLAQEVVLIFNKTEYDIYRDAKFVEETRVKKLAVVKKNPDMNYVQMFGGLLLEDNDNIPWIVSLTSNKLPRLPKLNDKILIEGLLYVISVVKPINRSVDSVLLLSVYPDRTEEDELKIYNISSIGDRWLDILVGGNAKYYSFSTEEYKQELVSTFLEAPYSEGDISIYDPKGNVVKAHYRL